MPRGNLPKCETPDCGRPYLWTCQTCRHRFCGRHDDVQVANVGHDCAEYVGAVDIPDHLPLTEYLT